MKGSFFSLACMGLYMGVQGQVVYTPGFSNFSTSAFQLDHATNLNYTITDSASDVPGWNLILCQTNTQNGVFSSTNAWLVGRIMTGICINTGSKLDPKCPYEGANTATYNQNEISINLSKSGQFTASDTLTSFFFCFSSTASMFDVCHYNTPLFDLEETASLPAGIGSTPEPRGLKLRQPIGTAQSFTLTATSTIVVDVATSSISATSTASSALTTAAGTTGGGGLASKTASTTISSSSGAQTTTSTPSTSEKKSGGLSTGAKVGIAIGALAIAAVLLLLALFFLRRKHRARRQNDLINNKSAPEQAMLTQDMHVDSFQSRNNILAEKDEIASSSTPLRNLNGSGDGQAAVPRRKPIETTTQPTSSSSTNPNLARGLSSVSRASDPNTSRSVQTYHYNPTHAGGGGTTVPFLAEEGMSAEEVARLEEEERRIDAAIAEAEGRDGR